jgi:hypothetical protein
MSASVINVHSHPILPAYRKALDKASGKPPEEATVYGNPVPSWNVEPVLVHYFDLLRVAAMGVS